MIHHHPDDALLLAQAAGRLGSGHSLLVASHLENCAECRERVRALEAVGGSMLEELEPAVLNAQARVRSQAERDLLRALRVAR